MLFPIIIINTFFIVLISTNNHLLFLLLSHIIPHDLTTLTVVPNGSIVSPGSSPEMHDLQDSSQTYRQNSHLNRIPAICLHIWLCCRPCPEVVTASPISQSKKLSFQKFSMLPTVTVKPNVNLACGGQPWARCCRYSESTQSVRAWTCEDSDDSCGPQSSWLHWALVHDLYSQLFVPSSLRPGAGKLVMSSVCTMHLRETKSHLEVGTKGGLT